MWPFSRRTSSEREYNEYLASKTDFMQKITEQIRDLEHRLKHIEREHEDLHSAYRRLRGATARDARTEVAKPPGHRGDGAIQPQEPLSKHELRMRFLTPRGPGTKPESD
jgi:hypothetical protein